MNKKIIVAFLGTLLSLALIMGIKSNVMAADQTLRDAVLSYDESLNFQDRVDEFTEVKLASEYPQSGDIITTFKKKTLMKNGDDSNKAVFVIMGDGFTKSEQGKFEEAAKSLMDYMLETEPYKSMKESLNFYAFDVVSNQSGAAKDPSKLIDTYFKCSYNINGVDRLLYPTDQYKVYETVNYYFSKYDQAIILVNDEKYGGGGGTWACGSLHYLANEIMIHEIGHSFGLLSDEYWYVGREAPNMTQESNPSKVKWSKFIDGDTIGVFQFTETEEARKWYRPSQSCKMRYLGLDHPYCKVCENQIKNIIKEKSALKDGDVVSLSSGKYLVTNAKSRYVEYYKPLSGATTVTIPATVTISGVKYTVKTLGWDAFYKNKKVTKVKVGKNITEIEEDSFSGASALKSITFEGSVKYIGPSAFKNCTALTTIALPNTVKTIGDYAFYGCKKLSKLTLPSGLTKIGNYAFSGCSAITGITVPSKVTKIGNYAFNKTGSLKVLKITSTKLTSNSLASHTFSGLSSKVKVKVPKSKASTYKTLFRKKGLSSKNAIIRY